MEQTCVDEYIFLAGLDVLSQPYLLNEVHVPHTGLIFLWFTPGRTGHIIIKYYSYPYSNLLPLLSGLTLGSFLLVSISMRPDLQ